MIISDMAVENRTTVFFLTAVIVIAGLYCYFTLPRESAPDVQIPFVFVTTSYRGGSPADMEKLITIPIEDRIQGLSGVEEIKSISTEGQSLISVKFGTDINIDDALPKVKDKVDLAKVDLPVDMEEDPVVSEVNFSEFPILILSMSGDFGQSQLGKLADDLKDDIEKVQGVLECELSGKRTREIQIQVDPMRLVQYQVPMSALQRVIVAENQNVSGGAISTSEGRYQLRVPGEMETVNDLLDLVIAVNNNGPVYLRDVATVVDGFEDLKSTSRMNGKDSITLSVKKRAGSNIVEVVEDVQELIAERKKQWPKGLTVTTLQDQADEVHDMVADLENNILTGLLLVVLVVCVAMGFRNALIVSLSIPLSMLLSFIILKILGITLNMVVLFSLTLALGMLVDNAIVIVENIFRFMQEGVPRIEAAKAATSEVAWPIIGSGLTTIGAFFPLLWWDGVMGGWMVYLPKTVITTLASCLFVAMIINPAIASVLMRAKTPGGKTRSAEDVANAGEHPMLQEGGWFLRVYRWLLAGALRYRLGVVTLAVGSVVVLFMFWYLRIGLEKPVEFFPSPDPDITYVNLKMPEGAGIDYCDAVVRNAAKRIFSAQAAEQGVNATVGYAESLQPREATLKDSGETFSSPSWLPGVRYVFESASIEPGSAFFGEGSESNHVGVKFVDLLDRSESTKVTQNRIAEIMRGLPGAEVRVDAPDSGPATGAAINIEISGENFERLGVLANRVKDYVRRVDFVRNVRDDYESGSPTLEIDVDKKKAALLGLNTDAVGFLIKAAFSGVRASYFRELDEKYDIRVRFLDKDRDVIDTLRRIFLVSESAGWVPLTTVASIRYTGGLGRITRVDNKRVVTVQADVDPTKTTGAVALEAVKKLLAGSSRINRTQIEDWDALVSELQSAQAGRPMQVVVDELPDLAREALNELAAGEALNDERKYEILSGLNHLVESPDFYDNDAFSRLNLPEDIAVLLEEEPETLSKMDRDYINRGVIETVFAGAIGPNDLPGLTMPPGYAYSYTGEDEEQTKAMDFLSKAMAVALILILFILVAQFNSVFYPAIILSAVLLSIGGAFLGLGIAKMPFGIIMTGVGVISLAGVVVNNAIVLVDYTILLRARGMATTEAIIAAGATRLRPVLLTAVTTVLGLIPMAVGWSIDFRKFAFIWESESSQWWSSMATPVIFGLLVATFLTLFVVPVLFSLTTSLIENFVPEIKALEEFLLKSWVRLGRRVFRRLAKRKAPTSE